MKMRRILATLTVVILAAATVFAATTSTTIIQFKRGPEASLPATAKNGEPLFTTDTHRVFVGYSTGKQELQTSFNGRSGAVTPLSGDYTAYLVGLGNVTNDAQVKRSEMGAASGVATLDVTGKVTLAQMPPSLIGAVNYQGVWNASTNTPTLVSSTGFKGFYYKVSTAGSTNLDGNSSWFIGDWAIFNGSTWDRVANTEGVSSVNGREGSVVLTSSDVGLSNVANVDTTNAGNISSGTLNHARLPSLVSGDIPNNAANTSGTAALATALAATPSACSSGQAPNRVDAQGNALGCFTPSGTYTLPPATTSTLGGVTADGTSILVDGTGKLSSAVFMIFPPIGVPISTGSAWGSSINMTGISDSTSSTSSTVAASSTAVKAAYDHASAAMVYPSAGVAVSTGSAWGSSLNITGITDSTSTTSSTVAASATAVKAAYDQATTAATITTSTPTTLSNGAVLGSNGSVITSLVTNGSGNVVLTTGPTLTGPKETVVAGGTCSTSYNVNPANGTMVTLTLSGACSIGVTSLAAGQSFTLYLTQSSTIAPTFSSAFKWASGTAPTWSTSASKYDTVACASPDGSKVICGGIVDAR